MCGIAGFIDFNNSTGKEILHRMTDALSHRGPDASGYLYEQEQNFTIALGHRRLSIIDLSPLGNQPMQIQEGKYWIVYNGEIYNYAAIREELISKGYLFNSASDTEVILYAFREWGHQAIHKFIGMFAFVLYDRQAQKIFLYRDRPGVKPIYYYWKNGHFLFASELKSFFQHPGFKRDINKESVYHYLQYGFVPAPGSIFNHTYKVEPGHYLELNLASQTIHQTQYWTAYDYYNKPVQSLSEEEALAELEQRLTKACGYRMVSDVPVGVFLSGGYDSSLITAILQKDRTEKIKTFTIGFREQNYNEAAHAEMVAKHLGTDHHAQYCSNEEAKKIIPQLPYFYDEPFGDTSAIPTLLVSHFARKQVTVALSADGGDEIFGGYKKYVAALWFGKMNKKIPSSLRMPASFLLANTPGFILNALATGKDFSKENLKKYKKFILNRSDALEIMEYANRSGTPETLATLLSYTPAVNVSLFHQEELNRNIDDIRQMQAVDYLACLSGDILTKVDRASMSASLEAREPLLDQHIVEWVATLPSEFKIHNGNTKQLLKKLVHKYVPEEIMNRPKMGFSIPLVDWFRQDLRELFDHYLSNDCLNWHGLFNNRKIQATLKEYYTGANSKFTVLWYLLAFQMWYEQWMQKAGDKTVKYEVSYHL